MSPKVKIIQNKENLGFAEGMKVGIREVKSQYILLLNQDVVVDRNSLKKFIEVAESDPKIGIVGPTIYYWKDSKTKLLITNYQLPNIIWSCGTRFATGSAFKMKILYIAPVPIGCGEKDRGQYDSINVESRFSGANLKSETTYRGSRVLNLESQKLSGLPLNVHAVTGCCMLIKSQVIDKVGLLDNRLFMIHEDDDYCIRTS